MDDFSCSLLCEESMSCLEDDLEDEEPQHPFIDDPEDEYMGVLIEKEIGQSVKCFKNDETLVIEDWLKLARIDAIDWILKTRAAFGFRVETAYLSVTYFDRILSGQPVEKILSKYVSDNKCWAIRLLSIACLSLAAKMEESNVPALSKYSSEKKFNKNANTLEMIRKMELLVLTTLEWNMGIVIPFSFLSYFITKLCPESPSSPVFSKAKQLILATMKEVNLMDHKPSVIAAAATLVALDQQLTLKTVKLKLSLIPQHVLLEPNDVFGCYILIQRLYTRGGKLLHTPYFETRPKDMIENSNQHTSTKRIRLAFYDEESHGKGLHLESPKF
ncbi:cyclin-D5-1-like [Lotus japonicus]|uniref:cyclin-D5-1-like n=1 Tax=Lotus japonicus TaxID=34305 RepID=UPI0025857652|nr:cyclin-D5-1-like [Lotus japonicus]